MKFEMKKRILALALAGTTAFSVFGGAMSANAANVYWVALPATSVPMTALIISRTLPLAILLGIFVKLRKHTRKLQHRCTLLVQKLSLTVCLMMRIMQAIKRLVLLMFIRFLVPPMMLLFSSHITDYTKAPSYYTSVNAFAWNIGYTVYDASANGVVGDSSTGPIVAVNKNTGKYYIFDREVWETYYGSNSGHYEEIYINETTPEGLYFLKNGTSIPDMDDYKENNGNGGVEVLTLTQAIGQHDGYFIVNDSSYGETITNMYSIPYGTASVQTRAYDSDNYVSVDAGAGYTTLDAVDPTDIDAVLEETVYPSGVIYLYDYYDNIDSRLDADEIADAWADGEFAQLMYETTGKYTDTITPVTSYRGPWRS